MSQVLARMTEGWSGFEEGASFVVSLAAFGTGGSPGSTFWEGSSISRFKKSRANSSMEIGMSGPVSRFASSTLSDISLVYEATVRPFASRMGRSNSACAGRGGIGSRAFLFASRMWKSWKPAYESDAASVVI